MSLVSEWVTSLGKAFARYDGVFEDNGVTDLAMLGKLEIQDMITDLGIKSTHARVIYHSYKRDFADKKTKNLKPSVVMITQKSKSETQKSNSGSATANDDKKIDANKLDVKALAQIFPQDGMLEQLLKHADGEYAMAKALSLLQEQIPYLSKLQKDQSPIKHRGFLSHVQQNSADLCRSLFYALQLKRTSVWYDMTAGRLDSRGMADGIATSSNFVFIATKDSFSRPWTIYELLIAHILRKPIIIVVEADRRHGGMTFDEFFKLLPTPWEHLKAHEIMKIERRGDFWEATVNELNKRLNWGAEGERKTADNAIWKADDGDLDPLTLNAIQVIERVQPDALKRKQQAGERERQRNQKEIDDLMKKVEHETQVQFDGAMRILSSI